MPLGRKPFSSKYCMLRRSSQALTKSPLHFFRVSLRSSSGRSGNMVCSSATLPSSSRVATLTSLESSRVENLSERVSLKSVKSVKSPQSVGSLVELEGLAMAGALRPMRLSGKSPTSPESSSPPMLIELKPAVSSMAASWARPSRMLRAWLNWSLLDRS